MAAKSSRDNYDRRKTSSKPITGRSKRKRQTRTEQSGREQNRAKQNKAEQSKIRTEQNRIEQNRAEQNRTEQSRTEQNRARTETCQNSISFVRSGKFLRAYFVDIDGNEGKGETSKGQRHWVKEFQSHGCCRTKFRS
ncbi:hypothetical protein HZH68_005406 [Vespula germanica]|uniref:Uncharacterized protein n=1 Tax=Vespula germanica TaxID=30212 RepID=A0A834NE93_VESGE|nr:hypothetical protein HZH68_005406 [Vespula germanica]